MRLFSIFCVLFSMIFAVARSDDSEFAAVRAKIATLDGAVSSVLAGLNAGSCRVATLASESVVAPPLIVSLTGTTTTGTGTNTNTNTGTGTTGTNTNTGATDSKANNQALQQAPQEGILIDPSMSRLGRVSRVRVPLRFPLDKDENWYKNQCRADPRNILACSIGMRNLEFADLIALDQAEARGIKLNIIHPSEEDQKDYEINVGKLLATFTQETQLQRQLRNAISQQEEEKKEAELKNAEQKQQNEQKRIDALKAAAKDASDKAAAAAANAQQLQQKATEAAAAAAADPNNAALQTAAQEAATAAAAAKTQADQLAKVAADANAAANVQTQPPVTVPQPTLPQLICTTVGGSRCLTEAATNRLLFITKQAPSSFNSCTGPCFAPDTWQAITGRYQAGAGVSCTVGNSRRGDTNDNQVTCGGNLLYTSPAEGPRGTSLMQQTGLFTFAPC